MNKKVIKCAIYTRKSSEEGLEQDFNSLDAQREACEAYIKSQQHEGWSLTDKHYNDGGFSGGTLERPAVKELFQDIKDGKVDIVVVYKVDRLTRSLMDFAKIVEIFDQHSASFVSITQQFNTTTSMGRLTLNVLLSFAQFEREVTGERIRDKIAASKKKGMWVGGTPPLGYLLKERKLVIDQTQAEKVRFIFQKYIEFKNVDRLRLYLKSNEILTKNGNNFSKGSLYHLLSNKAYIGLITHKENTYQGEHKPILSKEIWEEAEKILAKNRITKKSGINSKSQSLLAGKLFDDKGNYMSPSHSNTRNRKYRYYVSQALIQGRKMEAGSISKIPAGEIEKTVIQELETFLKDTKNIQKYFEHLDISSQKAYLQTVKDIKCEAQFLRCIINKIVILKNAIEITINKNQLIKAIDTIVHNKPLPEEQKGGPKVPIVITKNIRLSSTASNGSVLIISDSEAIKSNPNPQLIKAIAKSFYWNEVILSGKAKNSTDIQKMENHKDPSYIKKILKLRFLAPEIIENILDGTQRQDLNIQQLFDIKTLDWGEQKTNLNL